MTKRLAFMLALALGACAGSGSGRVEYAAAVTVRSPELVTLEPDVYVLADADEPVFYTDNYYWLYRNNRWYRSHSYDRDWVFVSTPSARLRNIRQPTAYVRYQTRRHEARNTPTPMPQREPWRDDQPRTDVPNNVAPHGQEPLQPTEPQRAPQPYPLPPQQQSPSHDHHIDANEPHSPATPAQRPQQRGDVRVPEDGTYQRAPGATPPGQVKDDVPAPMPPGQMRKDDTSTHPGMPPGQMKKQDREDKKSNKADKRDEKKDDRAKAKDDKSEKDKKRDY